MNSPDLYLTSRLGRTNEAMKVAYIAGKRIFVLITKDYSIGMDIVKMESILPLIVKGEYDQETKTYGSSNFIFAENDSFFEHNTKPSKASIFLYSGKRFPENSVKAFVDAIQGYTSMDSTPEERDAVCKSIIIIMTDSISSEIPHALDPYTEIIRVPLISKNEFDLCVSEWLNLNEGVPITDDIHGLKKIADEQFLKRLYQNMQGLSPTEISSILYGLKARYENVYHAIEEGCVNKNFEEMLSVIRKDAERIISKANALSLKDTTNAPSPAGLKNIDKWLEEYGDRICHPENYERDFVMQPPRGIIVSGVPGSGKSMMAKHIAKTLNRTLVRLDIGDAMGKYVGDTEKGINDALRAVEELSPCILWIDEMEKAFQGGHEVTIRMIGKFLTWMQEKSDRGLSIFVFCTCNDISKMPAEMFRSGRFDEKYSIFMPSAKECGEIFESQINYQCSRYRNMAENALNELFDTSTINSKIFIDILNSEKCIPNPNVDVDETNYSRENKFFTGADIASVIEKAKNLYINDYGRTKGEYVFDSKRFIECLKKSVVATRTYGETNLDDIVKSFVQMEKNNFFSATTDEVIPFDGYDEVRYNSEKHKRSEGKEKEEPKLYKLDEERKFIYGKCVYDKLLYISVRNAINHLADKLISQSY